MEMSEDIKSIQEWSKTLKKVNLKDYAMYIQNEQMKYMEEWIVAKINVIIPGFVFRLMPEQQSILEERFTLKKSFMPLDGKMFEHYTIIDKHQDNAEIGWFAVYVDYVENKILFKGV